jgi:dihydrofolate synthase / folylpolyglutamate synthase
MLVTPVRTDRIKVGTRLDRILERYLPPLTERSIVVITSKIVSLAERRVVKIGTVDKRELVKREAEYYIENEGKYGMMLTIKQGILIPMAGIDESNGAGHYILWPKNAQATANRVRRSLARRLRVRALGVIITDSKTTPLRWGTTGVAIAHSGFAALKSYIGRPDLFGRALTVTKSNLVDGLAAAAVAVMGEGDERTPLAVIEDLPFIQFQRRDPTPRELRGLRISLEDDLYAPVLKTAAWKKGKVRTRTRRQSSPRR